MKTILVLSPHLDDAILSCGGWMAEAAGRGNRILVYNLFCLPYQGPFSKLAQEVHACWGGLRCMPALRLEEDHRAMELIGAEVLIGDVCDLIYRKNPEGEWLYTEMEDIQGKRRLEDNALVGHYFDKIQRMFRRETVLVCAPRGLGMHIDHLLAFDVGMRLQRSGYEIEFYEDLPYAMNEQREITKLPGSNEMAPAVNLFSMESLHRKVEALRCYQSQIGGLFGDEAKMEQEISRYALEVSGRQDMGGERVWRKGTM